MGRWNGGWRSCTIELGKKTTLGTETIEVGYRELPTYTGKSKERGGQIIRMKSTVLKVESERASGVRPMRDCVARADGREGRKPHD